ncbi:MAG: N-6 DNA methylase [Flavobacterium sp.]|nr:N-6 DNA methylase [Flavobacterium sp.]
MPKEIVVTYQTKEILNKISIEADWGPSLVTKETLADASNILLSSFKRQLSSSVINDENFPIDSINFSGDNPFIYFRQLHKFNAAEVSNLHRKIWNEGRTPLLGIITPTETRLYDCFNLPVDSEKNLERIQIGRIYQNSKQDIEELAQLLHQSKIDSGLIWEETIGQSIKTKNRVDRKLVNQLAFAREKLHSEFGFPFSVVHDLLGRSLFTLYLEDRGILKPENYPQKKGLSNFFDLLEYPKATIDLFDYLKRKFNGDLFPVTDEERVLIENNPQALQIIKDCFIGNDLISQQLTFNWRMFQFQYIPIELISSIYEEFMSVEDEEHTRFKKEHKKRNDGAFYTPSMLVEFVLNEVLPYPDESNNAYDLKILDPACGSGIFLVESYKRLIARWKYANKKEITEEVLEDLLLNNIYGIEYDSEAIKVTAFSLYLTYLDYIKPTKVLDRDARFEPLINWKNKQTKGNKKQGNNLFNFSTFSKDLAVFENDFDLVVGNPPWLRGGLKEDVAEYIVAQKIPKDIVCAYLDYMPNVAPNATIALISKAKVLFNTEDISQKFRNKLFSENNVESVINLSVVRDVIFENATAPAAVIIYKKHKQEDTRKDYVIYCVPKSELIIKNRRAIVIDASEVKFIPLIEILKPNFKVFKIAMWGNLRDFRLLEKLKQAKTLKECISDSEWGVGLKIRDNKAPFGNSHLRDYFFIPTDNRIDRYYTPINDYKKLGDKNNQYRTNNKQVFNSPIIIIKEGTKDSDFCSSYLSENAVFLSSVLGISIKNKDATFHKALVACLNSTLATYYYFITSSSWGIDKGGRVQNNDALSFPSFLFTLNEESIDELAKKVDEIISLKASPNEIYKSENINQIQRDIDTAIYKILNLSENEIALINDTLNFSVALSSRYKKSNAEGFADINTDILPYAKKLVNTITTTLKNTKKGAWVEILNTGTLRQAVNIIAIHFDNSEQFGTVKTSLVDGISKLLHQINIDTYQKHSETVYYRKIVKYYKKGVIYLVKPNQKRFWSISQALNDADDILLDLMTQ